MKRLAGIFLILGVALAGCLRQANIPVSVNDLVATEVSATLAALPTKPASPPSATAALVTVETPAPTTPPSATPGVTLIVPSATPTLSPSPSPTVAGTAVSGDPVASLGDPAWRDPFDSGSGWNLGEDSFSRAEVADGKLVLTGLSTIDGWRLTWPEVKDAYLEATIETGECSGNDHYGLMFRVPDLHNPNEGYLLGFTCDGRYWLRSWDGKKMEILVPLTASAAINAGGHKTNRVGVRADGDKLTLYGNGTLLQEITDNTWHEKGGFGLFVGARKTDQFTIQSDQIAYWDLP